MFKLNLENRRSQLLKKNIGKLFVVKSYSVFVGLLLVPLTLDLLDNYRFGIWATTLNLISFIHLFDIGIGNGLRNKFAEALAVNDTKSAREYVSTAYIVLSIITLVVILAFIFPWLKVDWAFVFNTEAKYAEEVARLILITVVITSVHFTIKLITTILSADHKPWLPVLLQAVSNTIVCILYYSLKNTIQWGLPEVSFIYMLTPVVVIGGYSMVVFNGTYKELSPSISFFRFDKTKDLLDLGLKLFLIQVAVLVIFQTDALIISHTIGPEAVTPYNIVYRYFSVLTVVSGIITTPLWSAFTEAKAQNDISWMKSIIHIQLKVFVLQVLIALVLILFARNIIALWVGEGIQYSTLLIWSMGVFSIQFVWNNIFSFFLNGISRTRIQSLTSLVAIVINIPISIILAIKVGVSGVIIATVISLLLFSVLGAIETYKYFLENE